MALARIEPCTDAVVAKRVEKSVHKGEIHVADEIPVIPHEGVERTVAEADLIGRSLSGFVTAGFQDLFQRLPETSPTRAGSAVPPSGRAEVHAERVRS